MFTECFGRLLADERVGIYFTSHHRLMRLSIRKPSFSRNACLRFDNRHRRLQNYLGLMLVTKNIWRSYFGIDFLDACLAASSSLADNARSQRDGNIMNREKPTHQQQVKRRNKNQKPVIYIVYPERLQVLPDHIRLLSAFYLSLVRSYHTPHYSRYIPNSR